VARHAPRWLDRLPTLHRSLMNTSRPQPQMDNPRLSDVDADPRGVIPSDLTSAR
jgi:hypothetical protein